MGWFEEYFNNPLILRFSKFYLRYIDDIFLIWNRAKEEVFLQKVNNYHPIIKSEYQISKTEISLLNTTVFEVGNQFHTKLYEKPNNWKSYLHSKSDHQHYIKNSIAYSQVLRLNKISQQERSRKNSQKLLKLLEALTEVMTKLKTYPALTKLLLFPGMKFWIQSQGRTIKASLIVTFNRTLPDLRHINSKNWHIL